MKLNNIVAIVGAPNSGKSTLFNRIVGNKIAVTSPVPGVTRDRIYSTADWNGKTFLLVDTGGIIFSSENDIDKETLQQSILALSEADLIIFLVDGQNEIKPIEYEISNLIRKNNKNNILVVNKIDDFTKHYWQDYYSLGFEDVIPISAIHGKNVGTLLDEITNKLPNLESETFDEDIEKINIAIVGKPNVGKSSLLNKLIGEDRSIVNDTPGTTRDNINEVIKYYGKKYTFIDTAGLRKKNRINEKIERYASIRSIRAILNCDIVLLLINAEENISDQDFKILDIIKKEYRPFIILVNKWDKINKDDRTYLTFTEELYEKARFLSKDVPIQFISALTGQRVNSIYKLIDDIVLKTKKKISTKHLNMFLSDLRTNYKPKSKKTSNIKLKYLVQSESEQRIPTFILFSNKPKDIPDNFKSFFIKQIKKQFNLTGVPIKLILKK